MAEKLNRKDELWAKCPAGAIQKVADSAVLNRPSAAGVNSSKRQFLITAATAAGITVLGGGAYLASRQSNTSNGTAPGGSVSGAIATKGYGGINCREVAFLAEAYLAETLDDQKKVEGIGEHLAMCSKCREFYESVKS